MNKKLKRYGTFSRSRFFYTQSDWIQFSILEGIPANGEWLGVSVRRRSRVLLICLFQAILILQKDYSTPRTVALTLSCVLGSPRECYKQDAWVPTGETLIWLEFWGT